MLYFENNLLSYNYCHPNMRRACKKQGKNLQNILKDNTEQTLW